jgi:hypothetical protein
MICEVDAMTGRLWSRFIILGLLSGACGCAGEAGDTAGESREPDSRQESVGTEGRQTSDEVLDGEAREGGCSANCQDKECGDDGCGGSCGSCDKDRSCSAEGKCLVPPPRSCNGYCGTYGPDTDLDGTSDCSCFETCAETDDCCDDLCLACPDFPSCCSPSCTGRECGDDGCGGSCGQCQGEGSVCVEGECSAPCQPDCSGKECGDDGCFGSCGECGEGLGCLSFKCVECTPDCEGKECGDDGCGKWCGVCGPPLVCKDGKCVEAGSAADCKDVVYCTGLCAQDASCVQSCVDQASPAGLAAFETVKSCAADQCWQETDNPAAFQLCIIESCSNDWSACLGGWGPLSCQAMLACMALCSSATVCEWGCLTDGSQIGQSEFWALQACIQANCSACGGDTQCAQDCAESKCLDLAYECQSD